jgi:phosphoserine phosphatase SerB
MPEDESIIKNDCLIAFDVEGVLIPKNRYLIFEISQKLGFFGFLKILILGLLYETSLLSLESALKRIYSLLKGFKAEEILEIHKKIPLIPGTEKVFEDLKNKGYKIALISSGLPTQVVQDLAKKLNVDYAYGLELEIINGRLTGAIAGKVIKQEGKYHVLKRILEKEKLTVQDCIVVADDRNNSSMFPLSRLRIGYNPDFVLTIKSDFVIRGALTEILPPITGEKLEKPQSNLSNRGLRETIHISSFLITFICIYITGNILLGSIILLLAVVYTISELARIQGINIPILSEITWNAANKTELYEFATAPIYFALGIGFSLLFLPEPIGYVAITVLTLGDGGAHIFGMKFGKTPLPFNKGKNVEGTIVGFVIAFFGSMLFISPIFALIAAAVGMLVEGIPSSINDNFTIPFIVGLLLILIM